MTGTLLKEEQNTLKALLTTNSKLGNIYSWYIPAITTCPGKTSVCEKACYAKKGNFVWSQSKRKHQSNLELSQSREFAKKLSSYIRYISPKYVRIHTSGDFYNKHYTKKWIEIIRKNSNVTFVAYTRSWRDTSILPSLKNLANLPNMILWFSADSDCIKPPALDGVRIAYMIRNDLEAVPDWADLVFRVSRKTKQKYIWGKLICPAENGVKGKFPMTCSKCLLCYKNVTIPSKTY